MLFCSDDCVVNLLQNNSDLDIRSSEPNNAEMILSVYSSMMVKVSSNLTEKRDYIRKRYRHISIAKG